jgi:hypothetical protein
LAELLAVELSLAAKSGILGYILPSLNWLNLERLYQPKWGFYQQHLGYLQQNMGINIWDSSTGVTSMLAISVE